MVQPKKCGQGSRLPKISRHSSGQARIRLDGRTIYLGKFGSPEVEANYNRVIAGYLTGDLPASGTAPAVPASTRTVMWMCTGFLKWAEAEYGEDSFAYSKLSRTVVLLGGLYGGHPVEEFGFGEFEHFRRTLVDRGWSRWYVNDVCQRVKRIFKVAASRKLVPVDVAQSINMIEPLRRGRTKARESERVLPVADWLVEKTLPHLPPVVRDMVRLNQFLGARPGEICKLKPGMIDRSGDVWIIPLDEHKNAHRGIGRELYVGANGQEILVPYLFRGANEYCFVPDESERTRRQVRHAKRKVPLNEGNRPKSHVASRGGIGCYTSTGYQRAILRACKKAFPVPEGSSKAEAEAWAEKHWWHANQLRHAFATKARPVVGLEATSHLLGHSDLDTTLIYAEKSRELAINAARLCG